MSTLASLSSAACRRPAPKRALTARGVRKRLGETLALADVDVEVNEGEVVALLGPNGAGKSTLLQVLAGLLRPDAGEIDVMGAGSPLRAEARRFLGFAPQATAIYDELSVEENLEFFGTLRDIPRKKCRAAVDDALGVARLEKRRADRVGALSGGMKRRLHVAAATLGDARILLLDEPFAGVDAESTKLLLRSLAEMKARGVAIVMSFHEGLGLEELAPRFLRLRAGRVVS